MCIRDRINFANTGKIDDEGQFLYSLSGVVRDSGTQIDHVDNKRYNIAPSLTWNIDPDTQFTLLTQFTRDDTGITSQFLPVQGTKIDMPFGDISHHKNLGDPDWEYYDRTYYALGYAFEHRLNDVWQFKQKTAYEMLRSLVGSEMCIRDRISLVVVPSGISTPLGEPFTAVSYTHLTLPTICSV